MSVIASELGSYGRSQATSTEETSPWLGAARLLAAVALGIGIVGLLGWLISDPSLRSLVSGHTQMKANTAIAAVLAAAAILPLASGTPATRARKLSIALAGAVGAMSLTALWESMSGIDLGIDQLLFSDVAQPGAPHPGRMAPSTAVALLLIAGAIALTASRRNPRVRQAFSLAASAIGLVALLGYASAVPRLYGFASDSNMALPSALAVLTLACAALATQPGSGLLGYFTRPSAGAGMAMRLLPAVIVIPTGLALLRFVGTNAGLFSAATGFWVVSVLTIVVFCALLGVYARRLDAAEDRRREEATLQQIRIEQLHEELERRAQHRASELEAANHELEAFAYSLAHDLRAPLRAVAGFGATLARQHGEELGESGLALVTRMRRASGRMGELIDGLLLLSELTRRQLDFEPVDLGDLANEVVEELRAEDAGRTVAVEIQEGLFVLGDEALLRILIRSLLENAWKFTASTSEPRIAVTRAGPGVFAVSDNGAGFNMDFADLLFKPFSRLHREDEFPGAGIGLTTAERIALRHGGALWGEGTPGAGATFYVKLDLLQEALI